MTTPLQSSLEDGEPGLRPLKIGAPIAPDDICPLDAREGHQSWRYWHANALRCLAKQLGFGNDFFLPLLTSAQLIDGRTTRQADRDDAILKSTSYSSPEGVAPTQDTEGGK